MSSSLSSIPIIHRVDESPSVKLSSDFLIGVMALSDPQKQTVHTCHF